jgi:hypothetical protein
MKNMHKMQLAFAIFWSMRRSVKFEGVLQNGHRQFGFLEFISI